MDAPNPKPYGSTWYARTAVGDPPRAPLSLDLDVDVCVIGGGLAGLTTAREVARRGWSVALLEANRIGHSASGRNCGFVAPGFSERIDAIVERVGLNHARELWALSSAGVEYVRSAIADSGMAGVDPVDGWLNVSKIDNGDEFLRLLSLLGQEMEAEVEGWPTERVRDELASSSYFHAIHFPGAFHIHPLNYALGLARAAEAEGARIFEQTPAIEIDPAGVRKRITTPSARLRASQIVLCGNLELGTLMPKVAGTLLPVSSYMIVTQPLGDRLAEAIRYRGGVSDTQGADNHYRIIGGDRLLWSGRVTTWPADPHKFEKALQADIKQTFPQLGAVAVDEVWSGTLGRTVHRMPQLGELAPGVWLASGFGTHGINTTAMAGELIARAIAEGDTTCRLFAPYELVWAGGIAGRAAGQVGYWWLRTNEWFGARRAQRHEAQHRLDEQREAALESSDQSEEIPSGQPAPEAPMTEEPVTEEPVTEEPVTEEPVREVPLVEATADGEVAVMEPAEDGRAPQENKIRKRRRISRKYGADRQNARSSQ